MGRKPQVDRLAYIYQLVQEQPGRKPSRIAQILGLHRSEVTRSLPALEEQGYLLSEDNRGGLWPFPKRKS